MQKPVVTYQSPTGATKTLCDECAQSLVGPTPPRDSRGQEYCNVARGRHIGECEKCAWTDQGKGAA